MIILLALTVSAQRAKWSEQQARDWYAQQPWLIGSNYNPASAINQLEMWQADSFDPKRIDLELGWAEDLGMNTMRVCLHDLLWDQDAEGFKRRLDQFLTIAARHKIKPIFVLFDAVWDPDPKLGENDSNGSPANRRVGRHYVSQLRLAYRTGKKDQLARAL